MTFSPPCRRWLFKLLNEGNRREWRTHSSGPNTGTGEFNVSGYRDVTYMPARSSQSNFLQQQRKSVKELKGNEGSGTEWDCGDLLSCLRTVWGKLRIFFIMSYVFLLDFTVRTIEPPVRKETWKELINSFNRGKALNCPYIKRGHKINDKKTNKKTKEWKI